MNVVLLIYTHKYPAEYYSNLRGEIASLQEVFEDNGYSTVVVKKVLQRRKLARPTNTEDNHNATAVHVHETEHPIDWGSARVREREKHSAC